MALSSSLVMNAQVSSVRLMTWNLLNWPISSNQAADTTERCPHFRTVIDQTRPDILVTQENSTTLSTTLFLNCALNANGNEYRQGSYIHGYDTNNGIFYKDSLFTFVSNTRIPTALRDINEFKLVFKYNPMILKPNNKLGKRLKYSLKKEGLPIKYGVQKYITEATILRTADIPSIVW